MSQAIPITILFAYQGFDYDGLERKAGANSVESVLFKAIARQYSEQISMTHISRAKITYEHEHAAKQVLSLNLGGTTTLPSVEKLNQDLPATMRVFKILKVDEDFSARRTCEARTVEFLIPTYAFQYPPEVTHYCYPEQDQPDVTPEDMPKGGMFKTMSRKHDSMSRRQTFMKPPESTTPVQEQAKEKKNGLFSCFKNLFSKKKPSGSERLKQSLNATLTRQQPKQEIVEEGFTITLKRSVSRGNRTLQDVLAQDISEREKQEEQSNVFEPLQIPEPSPEERNMIRSYRMSRKQYSQVQSALALFNGTHNFHNYISGSVQDDSRCFVHIFNIECAPLEIHKNMEWIRIKVQAHSFARDQIRKMMGMKF
jgi:tRNA pseudouridine(38-40) synthase